MPKYTQHSDQPSEAIHNNLTVRPVGSGYSVIPESSVFGPKTKAQADASALRAQVDEYAKGLVRKPRKSPENGAKSADELILDTPRIKTDPLSVADGFGKSRSNCLKTHDFLEKRALDSLHSEVTILPEADPLWKAAKKIQNCAINGAYQSISPTVNYKVGIALCKNRLCPNCQRVLSAKRKANALGFFEMNSETLRQYGFYHIVLPVRHSATDGVRTGLYADELLGYFTELRGQKDGSGPQLRARSWWNTYVAGGIYSMELAPSNDGSLGNDNTAHIHLHILAISKRKLYNRRESSIFKQGLTEKWEQITGDSYVTHVEPVYYKDPVTGEKIHCPWGNSLNLDLAVAETMKYTLKSDVESLAGFSDDFLRKLLTMRNRYFSRFGILTKKNPLSSQFKGLDMLNTDYKDLEALSRLELDRLLNPETGEIVDEMSTSLIITPQRNMRAKPSAVVQLPAEHEALADRPLAAKRKKAGLVRHTDELGRTLSVASSIERDTQSVGGALCFEIVDNTKIVMYRPDERAAVAIHLARTIKADYDPEADGAAAPDPLRVTDNFTGSFTHYNPEPPRPERAPKGGEAFEEFSQRLPRLRI